MGITRASYEICPDVCAKGPLSPFYVAVGLHRQERTKREFSTTCRDMGPRFTTLRALGCRGVTRADLRYDDTPAACGRLYLLEVNTQPGMTPTSLVPDIARYVGIGFDELVAWMVENASCEG